MHALLRRIIARRGHGAGQALDARARAPVLRAAAGNRHRPLASLRADFLPKLR
jgi:hypothetical protein